MTSPLTLPIARLRAAGCKVNTVIGHNPYIGGAHPSGRPNWNYSITLPESWPSTFGSISEALWSYNHDWESTYGDAILYQLADGRVIVYARQPEDPKANKPAHFRAIRKETEREVSVLLTRIADVVDDHVGSRQ